MDIRFATQEEKLRFNIHRGVWLDLQTADVLVAEDKGEVIGFLCGHMVYQVEHLVLLKGNRIKRSRAAVLLYRVMEHLIRKAGWRQMYCFTRRSAVKEWASRLGWTRCYKGAAVFTKFF